MQKQGIGYGFFVEKTKPRYTLHALHLVISDDWRAEGTKGVALGGDQINTRLGKYKLCNYAIVQLVVSLCSKNILYILILYILYIIYIVL